MSMEMKRQAKSRGIKGMKDEDGKRDDKDEDEVK